ELRPAQGRARAADEQHGDHLLHPRHRAQPAGALRGPRSWRPRQGPPGRALQGHPRRARRRLRGGPPSGPLEVRCEAGCQLMPRRAEITPRELTADPVYDSRLVTQVINRVMGKGKKSVAEHIVYAALERVGERTGRPPVEVLEQAVK